MTRAAIIGLGLGLALAGAAQADGVDDWTPTVAPADEAATALKAERYADAIPLLRRHLDSKPEDADSWTFLGFALRKTGAHRSSRVAYEEALALDPDHLNANAYFGALMVQTGDDAGVARQRATLARLCPDGCSARAALEAAIAGDDKALY